MSMDDINMDKGAGPKPTPGHSPRSLGRHLEPRPARSAVPAGPARAHVDASALSSASPERT